MWQCLLLNFGYFPLVRHRENGGTEFLRNAGEFSSTEMEAVHFPLTSLRSYQIARLQVQEHGNACGHRSENLGQHLAAPSSSQNSN